MMEAQLTDAGLEVERLQRALARASDETGALLTYEYSLRHNLRQQLAECEQDRCRSQRALDSALLQVEADKVDLANARAERDAERQRAQQAEVERDGYKKQAQEWEQIADNLRERCETRMTEAEQATTERDSLRQQLADANESVQAMGLLLNQERATCAVMRLALEAWAEWCEHPTYGGEQLDKPTGLMRDDWGDAGARHLEADKALEQERDRLLMLEALSDPGGSETVDWIRVSTVCDFTDVREFARWRDGLAERGRKLVEEKKE